MRYWKPIAICLIVLAFFAAITIPIIAANFIGNSNTMVFHYTSCSYAQKIKAEHRVDFDTRAAAVKAGYSPCKVCKP